MNAINALITVNVFIWLGFAGYCFFMAKKQIETQKRLDSLALQQKRD